MKYAEMQQGMYLVRTKELPWARSLSGNILYVCGLQKGLPVIQITEDCVPKGKKMAVGLEGDDGYWHDATDLVLEANQIIVPPSSEVVYKSPVAANYRNFLGLNDIRPFEGDEAEEQICVLGEVTPNGTVFSKTGYFVVAHADGWYIAYQGFCDYVPEGKTQQTVLRVLMLGGNRRFYPAKPVIDACMVAYNMDVEAANQFEHAISVDTSDAMHSEDIFEGGAVRRMNLGV